jgi:hypothetical protein
MSGTGGACRASSTGRVRLRPAVDDRSGGAEGAQDSVGSRGFRGSLGEGQYSCMP